MHGFFEKKRIEKECWHGYKKTASEDPSVKNY